MRCGANGDTTCMARQGDQCMEHLITDTPSCLSRVPLTNADRIRSMSNMELAEMLVRYDSNLYRYYCPDGSFCDDEDSALSFALDWLDKPAKEE